MRRTKAMLSGSGLVLIVNGPVGGRVSGENQRPILKLDIHAMGE